MNLLAFETSTETLSVAVQRGASVWEHTGPGGAQASHGLLASIQTLLAQAGLELGALDALAFGRGPGSFTGLRTACAVAQGLAFGAGGGRGLRVLPIDTLHAVAEQARHQHGAQQVVAVLDARMDEVYAAHLHWEQDRWHTESGPVLAAPEHIHAPAGWTVAGNAQAAYATRLAPTAEHVRALPTAAALLRLAPALLAAGQDVDANGAMPLYLRDKVAQTTAEREALRMGKPA
jgi:tRNA threonylcarbamoyladenosine biosynthesis protein TsaB